MELNTKTVAQIFTGNYLVDYRLNGRSYHKIFTPVAPCNLKNGSLLEMMRMMLPQGAGIVSVVKLDPSVSLAKIEDPSCCDDVFESSSLVYIDPDLFAISMHEVMQWDFS